MAKIVLRSFLYLDEETVDDFVSQIEGGVLDGSYTETTTISGGKDGKLGLGFSGAQAGVSSSKSTSSETTRTIREPSEAKFARLYNLLVTHDGLQSLTGFDMGIYDQIEIGELVELRGLARLTAWDHVLQDAALMKRMNPDAQLDSTTRQVLDLLPSLRATTAPDDVLLIVSPLNAPDFKIVAKLDESKIRRKQKLETEVTILGKVEQKLAKGEKMDVFHLMPRLGALQQLNREQRRRLKKTRSPSGANSPGSEFDEIIKYPAIGVAPVAIYL